LKLIYLANQLAELGVMFLMFGVGMHFSLKDLLQVDVLPYLVLSCKLLLQRYLDWLLPCSGDGLLARRWYLV
jgi:predicted Kef-type K+ transport protein